MAEATDTEIQMTDEELCQEEKSETSRDDLDLALINMVKDYPYLYSRDDKRRYKDKTCLDRAWGKIAAQLGLPKQDTKTKWTSLRNNFVKAMLRRKSWPNTSYARRKRWVYEDEMDFLKDHLMHKKRNVEERDPSPKLDGQSSENQERATGSDEYQYHHLKELLSRHSSTPNTCTNTSGNTMICSTTGFVKSKLGSYADVHSKPNNDSYEQSKPTSQHLSVTDEATLKYIHSLEREKDEPLVGWFKTLLPSLKTLSPLRLAHFQISVMQEMLKLTAEEEFHQSQNSDTHTHIVQLQMHDEEDGN